MTRLNNSSILALVLLLACGEGHMGDPAGSGDPDAASGGADGSTTTPPPEADAAPHESTCRPPHLMIVLDRSGSFARRPNGTVPPNTADGKKETRWHIALTGIKAVAADLEDGLQFGLALFPSDPEGAGGEDCSNLDTWLVDYLPPETTDGKCNPGEVKVAPALMNADVLDTAITLNNTGLCSWTPIGAGLTAAKGQLDAIHDDEYEQYALLITDGRDNCDGEAGYSTGSMAAADAMQEAGIDLYVVGFDGTGEDLDPAHLNNLACAGHTAVDFASNCVEGPNGFRAVASPSPARLYYLATELGSLQAALAAIGEDLSCDIVD
jgi:von Willebrand factor type A domain